MAHTSAMVDTRSGRVSRSSWPGLRQEEVAKGAHLGKVHFEYTIRILSSRAIQRIIAQATPVNIDCGIMETRYDAAMAGPKTPETGYVPLTDI